MGIWIVHSKASADIPEQVFRGQIFSCVLGGHQSGITERNGRCIFTLSGAAKLLQSGEPSPSAQVRVSATPQSPTHWVGFLILSKCYHTVTLVYTPWNLIFEHLFVFLLAICTSSLVERLYVIEPFLFGYLLFIDWLELFIYSVYKSFVRYTYSEYFLPVYDCLCVFLMICFKGILKFWCCLIFQFVLHRLVPLLFSSRSPPSIRLLKKSLSKVARIPSSISSGSFIVLACIWCVNCNVFICVWEAGIEVVFSTCLFCCPSTMLKNTFLHLISLEFLTVYIGFISELLVALVKLPVCMCQPQPVFRVSLGIRKDGSLLDSFLSEIYELFQVLNVSI